MLKRTSLLITLISVLALTTTALAQDPVLPGDSDPTWKASYWNNTSLSGSPVLQRDEANLDYNWGTGRPHTSVNADGFSARWTRYIYTTQGTYRFTATSDDGIRVWVDNDLIIDKWSDHPATTYNADKALGTGHHWVVVEFYENKGEAVAKLTWAPTTTPVQNWRGEYFNNTTLSGTPALVRDDAHINFDWGALSPDTGVINVDRFSARWSRTITLPAGRYRFSMTVDDGGRLWVNNHLLLESWRAQPATTYTEEIYLPGGAIPIVMEYYEDGGLAVAKLTWEQVTPSIQHWRGEYFANLALSGTPALVRDDAQIDFNWSSGSPAPGTIGVDKFSVRWTRTLDFAAGRYRFTMTTDDGVRLWVNNQLLINAWHDQAQTTYSEDIDLPGGPVPIKVEYYENGGVAVARLTWSLAPTPTYNWRGEYYNNMALSGSPTLVRDDAHINFDWGAGSPVPSAIAADGFSVRWTRTVNLAGGRYRFAMTVDDGGRLWVNGHLLIDAWREQSVRTYTGEMDLPGGAIPIKMEYYEQAGLAVAQLSWSEAGASGSVIVDDTDAGFIKEGVAAGWRVVYEGYGGRLTWTWNNESQRTDYNRARWVPSLAAGRYEVFVFIPYRYTTTAQAHYGIAHAAGTTQKIVDQSMNGDRWVSLGTYNFNGTGNEYVSLSDVTGESQRSRLIAFDAVMWVPR